MAKNAFFVPDPLTPPPGEDGPYYEAIGRFIVAYAAAESTTHELARKLSGLKEDKARILFGGMRLGDVTARTRALLRIGNRSPATKKDIESCLAQLDVIGAQRDKIVHRHLHYHEGAVHVHNMMTAKSVLQYEQDQFSLRDLLLLQLDCLSITLRLNHFVYPQFKKFALLGEKVLLHKPWRYKPPAPQNQKKQTARRKVAQALLNQPKPSPK